MGRSRNHKKDTTGTIIAAILAILIALGLAIALMKGRGTKISPRYETCPTYRAPSTPEATESYPRESHRVLGLQGSPAGSGSAGHTSGSSHRIPGLSGGPAR